MEKFTKFILSILAIACLFWLGGVMARYAIAYDIFEPVRELPLKTDKPIEAMFQTVYLYTMLSINSAIAYIVAFVCVVILAFQFKNKWKQKGWIFMAMILFALASPVEFYRIYLDFQLIWAIFVENIRDFTHYTFEVYFIERYRGMLMPTLGSLSVMSNITALLFLIWKPLNRQNNIEID